MATILHLVNQSPFDCKILGQCLQVFRKDDGILFYGNGVYAALKSQPHADELQHKLCFVIEKDLMYRGVLDRELMTFERIDYPRFVTLTTEYDVVQSWY